MGEKVRFREWIALLLVLGMLLSLGLISFFSPP